MSYVLYKEKVAASGSHVQNQHQHWPRSSLSCCWRCCVAKYVFVAFLANWQTEFAQCPLANWMQQTRTWTARSNAACGWVPCWLCHNVWPHPNPSPWSICVFSVCLTQIACYWPGFNIFRVAQWVGSLQLPELWRLPCHLKLFQITHFADTVRSTISAAEEKAPKSAESVKIKQRT